MTRPHTPPSRGNLQACWAAASTARGVYNDHARVRREEAQPLRGPAPDTHLPPWGHAGAMMMEPSTLREAFEAKVATGELRGGDAGQAAAMEALEALERRLELAEGAERGAVLPERGVYLHGGPGRGKTMLMDLFFQQCEPPSTPALPTGCQQTPRNAASVAGFWCLSVTRVAQERLPNQCEGTFKRA